MILVKMWTELCRRFSPFLLIYVLTILLENVRANEVIGCGGFLKSDVEIDYSRVEIRLISKQGAVKDKTDCSPSNGYYFLPVYDKGDYILQISPPAGWSFEPAEVSFKFDGKTDICSQSKDINFQFQGFGITGSARFANSGLGAQGVQISLSSKGSDAVLNTITDQRGVFSFTPIIPGSYAIRASHAHWHFENAEHQVTVQEGNTELPENYFIATGFDLMGRFNRNLQQLEVEAAVALFPKRESTDSGCRNEEAKGSQSQIIVNHNVAAFWGNTTCYVLAQPSGDYLLPNVASGKYLLVPIVLNAKKSNLRWSPPHIQVEVLKNFKKITDEFQVEGFDVSGQVLSAPSGKAVSGAIVKLNGKHVTTSDERGAFTLANIKTENVYSLQVEAPRLQFKEQRVKLEMSTASLSAAIVPSALEVCGRVESKRSQQVAISGVDNTLFHTTVRTEPESGIWCTFLAPGKYRIAILKSMDGSEKGTGQHLQFTPLEEIIHLLSEPLQVRPFTQVQIKIQGSLKCLPDAPYSSCLGTQVTLSHLDSSDSKLPVPKHVATAKDGSYQFDSVSPGHYEVTIPLSTLCFNTVRQVILASLVLEKVPDFIQTGYEVEILSSHSTKIKYSHSTEAAMANELNLMPGINKLCVPKMGVYNLVVDGCHLYDTRLMPNSFSTMDRTMKAITLNAIAHEIGVEILSNEVIADPEKTLQLQLESLNTGKTTVLTPFLADKHRNPNGKYVYLTKFHLHPEESLKLTPISDLLLFEPNTKVLTGSNDCVDVAFSFVASRGLILQGRVLPPLSGALISLGFPQNPELKAVTTLTDERGEFQFNPIADTLTYELTGEKESYVFGAFNRTTSTFNVHKLCKIIVEVRDELGALLPGVLVSLSGGESYRKNLITGDSGVIDFHSLTPSEYFIRPMLKEYKFEPNSKVISVKNGETVEIKMSGKRIAYSVYGYVTSLNGTPLSPLTVEATANDSCLNHQEEATTESTGQYRLRGLQPDCEYEISLKPSKFQTRRSDSSTQLTGDNSGSNLINELQVEDAIPQQQLVSVHHEDVQDINFIGLIEVTYVDVIVYVAVSSTEWYKTLRLVMYRMGADDSPIYNQRVEGPLNQKTENNDGTLMTLPRIPLDRQTYVVELKSSLSDVAFKYELPSEQFVADTGSVYLELIFEPELRSSDPDVTHGSLSALVMVGVVVVVFFKQDFALMVFWMMYDRLHQLVEDMLAKRQQNYNGKSNGNGNNGNNSKASDLNQKEIEQIAEEINTMKKRKTKKL